MDNIINKDMNTIKFTNYNSLNQPQTIILTMFGKQKMLNKITYTKDFTSWYTIKNNNYA